MTVQQAIQHACSRGFTDGGCDSRDCGASTLVDTHISIVDEVFPSDNWHTLAYVSARTPDRPARPPRSHWRHRGGYGVDWQLWKFSSQTAGQENTDENNLRHP